MLDKIFIRNFKSLQNVSLELKDVNLLIGANNSGKSNLLKALEFLNSWVNNCFIKEEELDRLVFKKQELYIGARNEEILNLTLRKKYKEVEHIYSLEIYGFVENSLMYSQFYGQPLEGVEIQSDFSINNINYILENFYYFTLQASNNSFFRREPYDCKQIDDIFEQYPGNFAIERHNPGSTILYLNIVNQGDFLKRIADIRGEFAELIFTFFSFLKIYHPNPSQLTKPYPTLAHDYTVKADASNLVSFLDNMRDEYPEVIEAIVHDLNYCVDEFKDLRFQKVDLPENHEARKIHGDKTFKKFGLYDTQGQTYWADELSEGTLYFLALLAIIHQPNPPKLLLLEEPEKGIHPRRIKEVMQFIFDLSEEKGIQVILTSHNPDVLSFFRETPEKVFVFDKPKNANGATTIKNLYHDIVIPTEKKAAEKGVQLDLLDAIGDNWVSGFFGGVPFNH